MLRKFLVALVAVALLLVAAGCGGGDERKAPVASERSASIRSWIASSLRIWWRALIKTTKKESSCALSAS